MSIAERLSYSLRAWTGASLTQLFWYGFVASVVWLVFYIVLREKLQQRRISSDALKSGQFRREFLHSLRSIAIFGFMAALMVQAIIDGWTRMYFRVDEYGSGYFFVSIALVIVVHDAYFYWTHRMMHHRWLYRTFHHTHHLSTSPSPWAAYAFSPWRHLFKPELLQSCSSPFQFIRARLHSS